MKFHAILTFLACTASATAAVINPVSSPEDAASVLFRRDSLTCNTSNVPGSADDCDRLYDDIRDGIAYANLETANPRTIRYNSCFVSWSDNVVGHSIDLLPYINTMKTTCVRNQRRSGIIKGVRLHNQNKQFAICLSSRGTGCKN
ncbi:hypothetical protein V8F06_004780 [Rhypophila decipiens]